MLLADVAEHEGPIDQFKQEHVPKKKKREFPEKINHVMYCDPEKLVFGGNHKRGYAIQKKWSEVNQH